MTAVRRPSDSGLPAVIRTILSGCGRTPRAPARSPSDCVLQTGNTPGEAFFWGYLSTPVEPSLVRVSRPAGRRLVHCGRTTILPPGENVLPQIFSGRYFLNPVLVSRSGFYPDLSPARDRTVVAGLEAHRLGVTTVSCGLINDVVLPKRYSGTLRRMYILIDCTQHFSDAAQIPIRTIPAFRAYGHPDQSHQPPSEVKRIPRRQPQHIWNRGQPAMA